MITRLESALTEKRAVIIERTVDGLVAQAPVFTSSWNVLAGFDRCVISVHAEPLPILSYSFSTIRSVLVFTVAIAAMTFYHLSQVSPAYSPTSILFPLIAWLWVIGGNYLVLGFRLRRFLRRSVVVP
jgi:hypothetical protein